MTRELGPIHDAVQAAALEALRTKRGVDTAIEVLATTGYDDLLQAYYAAAVDHVAAIEAQRDAAVAACRAGRDALESLLNNPGVGHLLMGRAAIYTAIMEQLRAAIVTSEE